MSGQQTLLVKLGITRGTMHAIHVTHLLAPRMHYSCNAYVLCAARPCQIQFGAKPCPASELVQRNTGNNHVGAIARDVKGIVSVSGICWCGFGQKHKTTGIREHEQTFLHTATGVSYLAPMDPMLASRPDQGPHNDTN